MATLLNIILIVTKLIFDVAATSAVFFKKEFFPQTLTLLLQGKNRIGPYQAHLDLKSPVCNSFHIALEMCDSSQVEHRKTL